MRDRKVHSSKFFRIPAIVNTGNGRCDHHGRQYQNFDCCHAGEGGHFLSHILFRNSFEACDYYEEVAFSISLLRHTTGLVRLVRAAREKVKKRSKASCSPSLRCQKAQLEKEKAFSWLSLVLESSRSKSRVPTEVTN